MGTQGMMRHGSQGPCNCLHNYEVFHDLSTCAFHCELQECLHSVNARKANVCNLIKYLLAGHLAILWSEQGRQIGLIVLLPIFTDTPIISFCISH
jgi:hypothetical protein